MSRRSAPKAPRKEADNSAEGRILSTKIPRDARQTTLAMKTPKRKRDIAEPAERPEVPLVVVLASNCTVRDVAALKTELRRVFDVPREVFIDIRSVERIDTATLQLLCAFVRDRREQGHPVAWYGETQCVQDTARLLGMHELLALPRSASKVGAAA